MSKHQEKSSTNGVEIEALRERLRSRALQPEDWQLLERLLGTLLNLLSLLQQKNASLKRLKRLLFGPRSDKRSATQGKSETAPTEESAPTTSAAPEKSSLGSAPRSRRGHGRRRGAAYTGAPVVACQDPTLQPGASCPDLVCPGHLYDTRQPAILLQLTGQPLVGATRYEQQVLRCSACQTRYTASLPAGVKPEKFDPTADVAIALAKYGAGLPFYRLARWQESCGVPLAESVQFERCEAVADVVLPVFVHLERLAADGAVLYADDTRVKILECEKENKELAEEERRSTQTSGIVVEVGEHRIALYRSGRRHAGENLEELLDQRSAALERPIQMSDALSVNWSGEQETIAAKCLAHARRKFIELEESFPQECAQVLAVISQVYAVEAESEGMTPAKRLQHHQQQSGPVLLKLKEWIGAQFKEQTVEPNSALGQALRYLLKHWDGLTRFLHVPNAPLDNNVCERALKRAVLLRKNALFYKTEHGAAVGDILLSLIETCRLNQVNVWQYLVTLVRRAAEVRRNPAAFLPWNYPRAEVASEAQAA